MRDSHFRPLSLAAKLKALFVTDQNDFPRDFAPHQIG